ncbi:hypothetical protein BH10BAC5_BH10BAC5_14960 [soil metagenome]
MRKYYIIFILLILISINSCNNSFNDKILGTWVYQLDTLGINYKMELVFEKNGKGTYYYYQNNDKASIDITYEINGSSNSLPLGNVTITGDNITEKVKFEMLDENTFKFIDKISNKESIKMKKK